MSQSNESLGFFSGGVNGQIMAHVAQGDHSKEVKICLINTIFPFRGSKTEQTFEERLILKAY